MYCCYLAHDLKVTTLSSRCSFCFRRCISFLSKAYFPTQFSELGHTALHSLTLPTSAHQITSETATFIQKIAGERCRTSSKYLPSGVWRLLDHNPHTHLQPTALISQNSLRSTEYVPMWSNKKLSAHCYWLSINPVFPSPRTRSIPHTTKGRIPS